MASMIMAYIVMAYMVMAHNGEEALPLFSSSRQQAQGVPTLSRASVHARPGTLVHCSRCNEVAETGLFVGASLLFFTQPGLGWEK